MIPFKAETGLDYCTLRRIDETAKFLDFLPITIDVNRTYANPVLDIGSENAVGDYFKGCQIPIVNVNSTDFNYKVNPTQKYDTVFCFEVIEHLMNPLLFMEEIRDKCVEDGGVVYLSTPVANRFGFYFNEEEHFCEYRVDKLKVLFEYAGFKVEKEHKFRSIPFWKEVWRVKSLRSVLRALTTYTVIFKLRAI